MQCLISYTLFSNSMLIPIPLRALPLGGRIYHSFSPRKGDLIDDGNPSYLMVVSRIHYTIISLFSLSHESCLNSFSYAETMA